MIISRNSSVLGHIKSQLSKVCKDMRARTGPTTKAVVAFYAMIFVIPLCLFSIESNAAEAELPPPPPAPPSVEMKLPLSLEKAIQMALENNLEVIIEKINPQIREAEVDVERGIFDPSVKLSPSRNKSVRQTGSFLAGADALTVENTDLSANVGQKIPLGGTYGLKFSLNNLESSSRFQTLRPQHTTNLDLSLTQPLFKNFGVDVTKSRIKIAKNNEETSKSRFEEKVMDILALAENTYWDLVFSIGELDVRRQSLKLAEDLIQINKAQVAVGVLAPIEILQAETSAAARETDVIVAESAVHDVMDRLKKIIDLSRDPILRDAIIDPTDKAPFVVKEILVDESVAEALERNPAIRQKNFEIETRKTNLLVARNAVRPTVDFQGGFGLNGLSGKSIGAPLPLEGGAGESLENLFSGDFLQWQFGINFEFPLGNRVAKNNRVKATLELDKSRQELKNIEQNLILSVREAVRAVATNVKRVNSTRIASKLAERQLDAEQKKFNVGLSTNFRVLTFQDDLAKARSIEIKAIIDYNKSLVNLDRLKGAILERNNVELQGG